MEEYHLKLQEIVLNTRRPILLKNFKTKWKWGDETLEKWCECFDKARKFQPVDFEQMLLNSCTGHPQWERERKIVEMTMKQFLENHYNKTQNFWTGLNYKCPDEVPKECKEGINFCCFGFPNLLDDFGRFWLTSTGANTPCHYDTYGCNIVVQVYGSKSWLLFPPDTPLTTTRLPYEESSVYCLENFYAPSVDQVEELQCFQNNAYLCQLNAGDALIVPHHWWHFVETIDTSLSINAWIPLKDDEEAQLHECIVKYLIETIVRQESDAVRRHLLNPNQQELCKEEELLQILAFLSEKGEKIESTNCIKYSYQYLDEEKVRSIMKNFPNAKYVEKADICTYTNFLKRNSVRFSSSSTNIIEDSPVSVIKDALIKSICSENVVKEIVREFQLRFHR